MVVLMEEFGGLSLKRKGADEPELFDVGGDDRSVFPFSCRATKMRRLAPPDAGQHEPAASSGGVGVMGQADLPMGDAAPSSAASAAAEEERAVVLYSGTCDAGQSAPRLRPCGDAVRAGADWVIRAMLREADSRTVRELLAGAQEEGSGDLALAVVPWVPPSPAAEEAEPSAAEEAVDDGDSDGAAAMDVEEDEGQRVHHSATRQAAFGGEGLVYRWPQHCMAPPQVPVVGQASPVMWSW